MEPKPWATPLESKLYDPMEPKPWATPLESKLYDALEEVSSSLNIYKDHAGDEFLCTLKQAETIINAERTRYEAMLAYRNERRR